jgi:predicted permease
MHGFDFVETISRDLLYSLRTMRKNPIFSATAVLTLALGIGGNTAIFAIIHAVLLKPLAYPDPDRLVQVSESATSVRFDEMKSAARSYKGLGDYLGGVFDVTLSGGAEPEVLKGVSVSSNFLSILEVEPLLGCSFRPEEETPGGPNVAMISAELWRRRFDGDAGILTETVTLAGRPYSIVGVLPAGFQFPQPDVDVWVTRPADFVNTTSPLLGVFARLNLNVGIEQATSELLVLNQQYRTAHPGMLDGDQKSVERVKPLRDQLVVNVRFMLWLLFGAVGFVLLIACANIASLLLARAAARSREFAVRAAIGASHARLMRQLLVESVALAIAGAAVGMLLAKLILTGIGQISSLELPRAGEIRLDGIVIGFSVLLSLTAGVLFGLIPSLGASRPDLADVLRASGEAASLTGKKRLALGISARGALVIGQVALSVVLVIGSALLIRSMARLYGVNPGFNTSNLLTLHISLSPSRYDTGRKQAEFFNDLVGRVQSLPGVRSAAATFTLPMMIFPRTPVQLASQPLQPLNQRPLAAIQDVTTTYFHTLGIPLKRGRDFSQRDSASAPLTAIINERLAHTLWPAYPRGPDPVGEHILIGARADNVEVVGIVADVHQVLEKDPVPAVFRPFDQYPLVSAGFIVRTERDPLQFVHAIRDQVLVIDRDQPISAVHTMEDLTEAAGSQRRLFLVLLGCFAGAALLLAVIGIYGVIAYSVSQRSQEIGIRRALGAQDADVLSLLISQGLALTLTGIVLGILGALALRRVMTSFLFQTSPTDPLTFTSVVLLFLVVAIAASYIPARRAARLEPTTVLRNG